MKIQEAGDSLDKPGQLTRDTAGPPFQELTSGWKQPKSVNERRMDRHRELQTLPLDLHQIRTSTK